MADAGLYRCNAFNAFGDSNANIDLNFESKLKGCQILVCIFFFFMKILTNLSLLVWLHIGLEYIVKD